MILAIGGSWVLPIAPAILFFISIVLMVVATGVLSSRKVLNHPPLEILRKDN